ncbi:helix-turn-helix transcriptional regulator [Leptothoe sp. PORK10 BA2]|uniref:helix-turn-helix transcriptional regulator n=1 Tax=Leptothoe sp. PORK10 BA2 TaxID=3110254 RepID=UPI002B22005B|nr:helix-turn-helix transcriptional regulator [Leptothoe sp. PORK10 BA2]MEA5464572.1 helix-turn-helix transcriptional regulator [Leptothoe sp. PORK10 BA2]
MSDPSPAKSIAPSEQALQKVMQRAKVSSQRALAEKANVSRWQVQQLRQGHIDTMRLAVLKQLAMALDCSLPELLQEFDPAQSPAATTANLNTPDNNADQNEVTLLRQEYARLERRLEQQSQTLQSQFQIEALRVLESWLTYWPTAAKAATDLDGFDAKKLLPLVKPIENLVASWGVTVIGTVGEQLAYDPQHHQLARGMANPGDAVRISHVGYRHGENLLQRAKVAPINPAG